MSDNVGSSQISVTGSTLGGSLMNLLMADDIQPGADPSYQLCKIIYAYHPLGLKMAETPIEIAQSQERDRVVQDAPNEVMEAFKIEWEALSATGLIYNTIRLARVYGIASVVAIVDSEDANEPLDYGSIWNKRIDFNVLDPLNTAGSLVLSQIPTNRNFNKPVTVMTNGMRFHPTRFEVMMNEQPVYLAYTSSAFGFVGRSVYQRALYPLKSFVRSMIADDMIATKLGLLVAKQKQPGSIIDNAMKMIAGIKRGLLKEAQTGQVLSIGTEESIETLNMMNVDGAGGYSRTNILKNVATAAKMPAKLLDNETLVSGFGEGTEDAKNIAKYIDGVRHDMEPLYKFFERITMYRAWNPQFYERIQTLYPEQFGRRTYDDAFGEWVENYQATWPSLLVEPESEQVKVDQTRAESTIAFLQTIVDKVDPINKMKAIQWAADNISENKKLFPHELELDWDELQDWLESQPAQPPMDDEKIDQAEGNDVAKKVGRFG